MCCKKCSKTGGCGFCWHCTSQMRTDSFKPIPHQCKQSSKRSAYQCHSTSISYCCKLLKYLLSKLHCRCVSNISSVLCCHCHCCCCCCCCTSCKHFINSISLPMIRRSTNLQYTWFGKWIHSMGCDGAVKYAWMWLSSSLAIWKSSISMDNCRRNKCKRTSNIGSQSSINNVRLQEIWCNLWIRWRSKNLKAKQRRERRHTRIVSS